MSKGLCSLCYEQSRVRVWTHEMNVAHYERRKQRKAATAHPTVAP
jgi:hypothetical protein